MVFLFECINGHGKDHMLCIENDKLSSKASLHFLMVFILDVSITIGNVALKDFQRYDLQRCCVENRSSPITETGWLT